MECNGEISDTDSGIILHSGSDSPTTGGLKDVSTGGLKDVSTHTRAMKLKHQSLQDRLELCVLELKKLCIREAELTGRLSPDYPLLPGEKPPQVRRRIGAAFKLDEQSIVQRGGGPEESQINSVDAELSLQTQIYEASRKLLQEEHLHKNLKRSRLQQFRREERRLKELQDTSFQLRLQRGRNVALQHDQGHSDDSSLSDSVVLDEALLEAPSLPGPSDPSPSPLPVSSQNPTSPSSSSSSHTMPSCPVTPSPLTLTGTPCVTPSPLTTTPCGVTPSPLPRHTSQASLDSSQSFGSSIVGEGLYDAPPIQHAPWSESSLDQPYEKKKKSHRSSTASSPASPAQTLPPLEACLPVGVAVGGLTPAALPQKLSHLKLRHTVSNSTPCTPEMQVRRQLSLRLPNNNHTESSCYDQESRGRVRVPRRRLTEYAITLPPGSAYGGGGAITLPAECPHGSKGSTYGGGGGGSHASEDSNSEHSSSTSYASSPCQDLPLPKQQHHQHYASSPCQDLPPPSYHHQPGPPFQQQQHYSPAVGMGPAAPPPFPNPGGGFYQNARHQSSPSFHHRGGYYHGDDGYPPLDPMGGYPQRDHPDMGGYPPLDHPDMGRTYYGQQAPCPSSRHDYSPNYRYMETPVYHPNHPHSRGALPPPPPQHRGGPPPPRGSMPPPDVRLSRSPSLWDHHQHYQQAPSGPPRQVVGEELCSWHQRSSFRGGPLPPRGGTPPSRGGPPSRPRSLDRQGAVRVKNPGGAGRGSPLFTRRQQYQPEQINQRRLQLHQRPVVVVDETPSVLCWAADDNSELFSQV